METKESKMTEADSIEKEFEELVNAHKDEIDAKVREASKALSEAVELSEKYGIPFRPSISFLRNSYFPESFDEKFSELDSEIVSDLTGAWREYSDGGWEHSAVC
jgi:hypothetical protein